MTPYIALGMIVIGMLIAMPLALRWDHQQRERLERKRLEREHLNRNNEKPNSTHNNQSA